MKKIITTIILLISINLFIACSDASTEPSKNSTENYDTLCFNEVDIITPEMFANADYYYAWFGFETPSALRSYYSEKTGCPEISVCSIPATVTVHRCVHNVLAE